jgi:hypothetical protein
MSNKQGEFALRKKPLILMLASVAIIGYAALSSINVHKNQINLFSLSSDDEREIEHQYIEFLARYGKVQASKEETIRRYSVFKNNFKAIQAHNNLPEEERPFNMELNWFADLSDEEIE